MALRQRPIRPEGIEKKIRTLIDADYGANLLAWKTVRESTRIQTFPDTFLFDGTRSEVMRQLGNVVPVRLASVIAESVWAAHEAMLFDNAAPAGSCSTAACVGVEKLSRFS